jgi:hypothetical protein
MHNLLYTNRIGLNEMEAYRTTIAIEIIPSIRYQYSQCVVITVPTEYKQLKVM